MADTEPWPLTDPELDVVRHLANGLTYRQIARRLCLSEWSIKTRAGKARKASGADTNCQLVAIVIRTGQLQLGEVSRV